MEQQQLADIFETVIRKLREKDFSREEFEERLSQYSNADGKVELHQMSAFLVNESRLYTELLLFDVLNKLRSEGYIISTNRSEEINDD
ncbi:hypothetical protein [Bacillus nitroreducens]